MPTGHAETAEGLSRLAAMLGGVADTLADLKRGSEQTVSTIHEMSLAVGQITSKVSHLDKEVIHLNQTVRDGNGQPSLMQRLTTIEVVVGQVVKTVTALEEQLNVVATSRMLTRGQIVAGSLGIVLTVLLSFVGVLLSLGGRT